MPKIIFQPLMIANPPERLTEERTYPALLVLATFWVLGITYPQSIKRSGHFLTADCKSARTPNGGKGISGATGMHLLRAKLYFVFCG